MSNHNLGTIIIKELSAILRVAESTKEHVKNMEKQIMGIYADNIKKLEDKVTDQAKIIATLTAAATTLAAELPDAADQAAVQGVDAFLNPPPVVAPTT